MIHCIVVTDQKLDISGEPRERCSTISAFLQVTYARMSMPSEPKFCGYEQTKVWPLYERHSIHGQCPGRHPEIPRKTTKDNKYPRAGSKAPYLSGRLAWNSRIVRGMVQFLFISVRLAHPLLFLFIICLLFAFEDGMMAEYGGIS
jgi:hypothetical protein